MQENIIKLSILIVTYNHAEFISKALNGIFKQEHNYLYEIIIGDDCSTDRTREILEKYYENNRNCIKLVFHKKRVGPSKNYLKLLELAQGQYISILDGDDYWDNPYKIREQISFLDINKDYVLSCHRCRRYYLETDTFDDNRYPELFENISTGFTLDNEKFFNNWITETLTVIFRKEAMDIKEFFTYKHLDDVHIFFSILQKGKGYAHSFFGGVYVIHKGGMWNGLDACQKLKHNLTLTKELLNNYPKNIPLERANTINLFEYRLYKYKEILKSRFAALNPRKYILAAWIKRNNPYWRG